ncbi:hypothetical protein AGMMS49992_28470 [Clostridia bacterium]|nr:hypothetical protein AGMMS49992_28470 [Clostridia bacterium]
MAKSDIWTPDNATRFTMRISTSLLDQIKASAAKNKRSTAKEIEYILEAFYGEHSQINVPEG